MHFEATSREKIAKPNLTPEKRQMAGSPLSSVEKVPRRSLHQQRIHSPEVSITTTKVSPVQSSLEVTVGEANMPEQKLSHVSMMLVNVRDYLVRNLIMRAFLS